MTNQLMKPLLKAIFLVLFTALTGVVYAQTGNETRTVNAKGIGLSRDQAIQDALRNAVSQAVGVAVQSNTKVENFITIQDAIATHATGYITGYKIASERAKASEYEVVVDAEVSMKPLKADANLLAKSIGGVRFLVVYDARNHDKEENDLLDYAVERMNQFLASRKYRYIEKERARKLQKEASNLMQEGLEQELGYAQQLAVRADAQFIIQIKGLVHETRSEAFDTRTSHKIGIEVKAFDNCTGEGLGTVVLNGLEAVSNDSYDAKKKALESAITNSGDQLLEVFATYIGDWINNGTPYELRFYDGGGFRELRSLRTSLKADASFGGDMEIVGADDYQKLNCTFKRKPDELADKVLDVADAIPDWKAKKLDVKFIYGRQISFAPRNYKIPGSTPQIEGNATGSESVTQSEPSQAPVLGNPKRKAPKRKK